MTGVVRFICTAGSDFDAGSSFSRTGSGDVDFVNVGASGSCCGIGVRGSGSSCSVTSERETQASGVEAGGLT
jgi:hypothetical protein